MIVMYCIKLGLGYEIKITTWGCYTEMVGRVRITTGKYELC